MHHATSQPASHQPPHHPTQPNPPPPATLLHATGGGVVSYRRFWQKFGVFGPDPARSKTRHDLYTFFEASRLVKHVSLFGNSLAVEARRVFTVAHRPPGGPKTRKKNLILRQKAGSELDFSTGAAVANRFGNSLAVEARREVTVAHRPPGGPKTREKNLIL